jgi:hypothetical protein
MATAPKLTASMGMDSRQSKPKPSSSAAGSREQAQTIPTSPLPPSPGSISCSEAVASVKTSAGSTECTARGQGTSVWPGRSSTACSTLAPAMAP